MSQIKYVSPNRLSYFLDKLKDTFAPSSHKHDEDYYTKSQVDDLTSTKLSVTDDGQGNVVITV